MTDPELFTVEETTPEQAINIYARIRTNYINLAIKATAEFIEANRNDADNIDEATREMEKAQKRLDELPDTALPKI